MDRDCRPCAGRLGLALNFRRPNHKEAPHHHAHCVIWNKNTHLSLLCTGSGGGGLWDGFPLGFQGPLWDHAEGQKLYRHF